MPALITNKETFNQIFIKKLPKAKNFVWIATADIKDLHIPAAVKRQVSFLKMISDLVGKGVEVRLIHAKEPGPRFRESFDKYPNLLEGMERALCPRNHMKAIIIDGTWCYVGSANLTGAGMGNKSDTRRNFEAGIVAETAEIIDPLMALFDDIWMGLKCKKCGRKEFCSDPINTF